VTIYQDGNSTMLATTEVNTSGGYLFSNLPAGSYRLVFDTPSGYSITTANQGIDDTLDSDINSSGEVVVTISDNNLSVDAGFYPTVTYSIGDYVWHDADKDGSQADEGNISGVTVQLFNNGTASGSPIETNTTDANGLYRFSNLPAGTYSVKFLFPSGYNTFSTTNESKVNSSGVVQNITLNSNRSDIDAGMYYVAPPPQAPTYTLGDYVWEDADENGMQGGEESGMGDVVVKLYSSYGTTPLKSTTTASNGYYQFDSLSSGTYRVVFETPNGYSVAPKDEGGEQRHR
jgi:serine-aspartate repeat-containing protein C/D/E